MDAALNCFVDRGFYGTAMPEIAERAGIASGTIYHYFESKDALVNALFRTWKTAVVQRVFAAFPPTASPRKQFEVVWHEIVAFALAHPTAFAFIELHNHASYLDDESRTLDRSIKDFTASILVRAQSEGLVKPLDPYLLMELVFGAFIAMMRAHWEHRIQLDDDVIRNAERACWDTIALHPS
jgi:TetR/AcrR family transcriptional regulator, repressor of fatR-cypB operon